MDMGLATAFVLGLLDGTIWKAFARAELYVSRICPAQVCNNLSHIRLEDGLLVDARHECIGAYVALQGANIDQTPSTIEEERSRLQHLYHLRERPPPHATHTY